MSALDIVHGLISTLSCLIDPLKDGIRVIRKLEDNADLLSHKAMDIRSLKRDVLWRLNARLQSDQLNEPSRQVKDWFTNVEGFLDQHAIFSASFNSRTPSCSFRFGCISNYKLSRRAAELVKQANDCRVKWRELTGTDLVTPVDDKGFLLLSKDVASIRNREKALMSLRDDLSATLQNIISQDVRMERSNRFGNWYQNVENFSESSSTLSDSVASMPPLCSPLCLTPSSTSCGCSSIQELQGRATELLEQASLLTEEGRSFTEDQLAIRIAQPATGERPVYGKLVGQEGELSQTLDLIHGDSADIIGICGMGGAGKTTLLRTINNRFCREPRDFDIVLWMSIKRDMNVEEIRGKLRRKLRLPSGDGVDDILDYLGKKSFLLLVDDVWDPLEFNEIGIPPLSISPKRKVVLTTRSRGVCSNMHIREENTVSMKPLPDDESWKLFCLHVNNEDILHDPSIELLGRDMAKRCGGLPLALSAVGKAMAGVNSCNKWKTDMMELKHAAYEFQNMDQVLSTLKFSYDRLKDDAMREIVLYCSLYPQGHNIFVEDLLGMLMAEGLVDTFKISPELASIRLQTWISHIVDAGLLLRHREDSVKLHDCVRDMAVWLTSGDFNRSTLFVRWSQLVATSNDFRRFVRWWQTAKRISMVHSEIEGISCDARPPCCDHLLTLLWEAGKIARIPEDFFLWMPHLKVLNMSNTNIKDIPKSIGALACLKYLNLQSTLIEELPEELGNLKQLAQLILRYAQYLTHIPSESISRLYNLERLDMLGTDYAWSWLGRNCTDKNTRTLGLKDLDCLAIIKLYNVGISLTLSDELARGDLCHSAILARTITQLELLGMGNSIFEDDDFSSALSNRIQILHINHSDKLMLRHEFSDLSELSLSDVKEVVVERTCDFKELTNLYLSTCWNLDWLPSIAARVVSLKVLRIHNCYMVESLLASEVGSVCFPCLKELDIRFCRHLRSISDYTLELRSLEELYVCGCGKLKRLPFSAGSAPRLLRIKGTTEWWNGLEWEDEGIQSKFLHRFIPIHD